MKIQEIKTIAKQHDIKAGKMKKAELIRAIQVAEGNIDCFATENVHSCDQEACLWRSDCQSEAKKAA